MTTTDEPIESLVTRLEGLMAKATPGEWIECIHNEVAVKNSDGNLQRLISFSELDEDNPAWVVALHNAAPRLLRELREAGRHDCDVWRDEGIGCAECNPTASAIREYWDDPVRRERDAQRAENERLRRVAEAAEFYLAAESDWYASEDEPDEILDPAQCRENVLYTANLLRSALAELETKP